MMYAFHSTKVSPTRYTPHVLPCRIHHDGPIESTERFWAPRPDEDGTQSAHFRGRKLRGRRVPLPDGYRGMDECDSFSGRVKLTCSFAVK